MHTRLALVALALALVAVPAIVLAGGAGGADGGPETAAAIVDTPNGSTISLAPAPGSNGQQYASFDGDGDLQLHLQDLNENAETVAHDVFVINVTASEPAAISVTEDASGVSFYWGDDPTANASQARTVQPGESISVGVLADSYDGIASGNFTVVAEAPSEEKSGGGGGGFSPPDEDDEDSGSLTVERADVTPTEIAVGGSATATATVVNTGSGTASDQIELAIDGTVVDRQVVTVPGGESETVTFERAFQQSGTFSVAVGGLDAGTVTATAAEGEGEDGAPGGFLVSNATLSSSVIRPGGTATVTANVTNRGDAVAFFTAELSVGGVVVEQEPIRVAPGATEQVSFERTFERRGGYDVAVSGEDAGTLRVESSTATSMRRYGSEWGWLLGALTVPTLGGAFVAARRRRRFVESED